MDRRSVAILAAGLALAAVLAVGAALAYAKSSEEALWRLGSAREPPKLGALGKHAAWWRAAWAPGPRLVVSEEYRERVVQIALRDPDVSRLLEEGYNVTNVKPIVKAYVEADGSVNLRADEALIVLRKDGGVAAVLVSLTEERVTKVVVHTVAVIEK